MHKSYLARNTQMDSLNTSLNNEATWQERAAQTQQQISEKTSVRLSKVSLHRDEKITPTCD